MKQEGKRIINQAARSLGKQSWEKRPKKLKTRSYFKKIRRLAVLKKQKHGDTDEA